MSNYNFNGLTNTLLPNVYINKITLDGSDAAINKLAANKESVIELHIEKRSGLNKGGWQGNPGEEKYVNANILTITYDLFLEVEELFDDIGMFIDDIFKYIEVQVITFKGPKGKEAYLHLLKNNSALINRLSSPAESYALSPVVGNAPLVIGTEVLHKKKLLDNIVANEFTPPTGCDDPSTHLSLQNKRNIIKQKYQHLMPDGRTIYKIPVRIKQEMLGGTQPQELAAFAACTLNTSLLYDDFFIDNPIDESNVNEPAFGYENATGRIATEVIIAGVRDQQSLRR